jgi:hypothetical protein
MNKHKLNFNYLKIFENCQLVLGHKKGIIYDLQRGKSYNVPLFTKYLINLFEKNTISDVFEKYGKDKNSQDTISEYFDFFVKNEICFEASKEELQMFPKLNMNWDYPSYISSCILSIDLFIPNKGYLQSLQILFNTLRLNYLLIEVKEKDLKCLKSILKAIDLTTIFHIDISIIDGIKNETNLLELESNLSFKVNTIFIYNHSKKDTVVKTTFKIIYINSTYNKILEDKKKSFYPLIDYSFSNYIEGHHHNLFYNRKIFIENNLIKEYRAGKHTIAKVDSLNSRDSILKLLKLQKLTKFWNIKKDNTDICKNCELRYFCLDDRIPENRAKDNTWYYNSECNYNPYIAKWQGEVGYKNLMECGIKSNADGLKINSKKLKNINKELWGDD